MSLLTLLSEMPGAARAVPTELSSYSFTLSPYFNGSPGTARLTQSVMTTFASTYAARIQTGSVYVDGTNGNDGNAGTSGAPLKTISAAMAKNPSMVYVAPGTYAPFSYRLDTHAAVVGQLAGGVVKWVTNWTDATGDGSGRVTIAVTAPDTIAAKTWTATGGYTDIYQATLTTSGSNAVHRVINNASLDSYGYPVRLLKCTSVANLDTKSSGWYWDSVGKVLYLKLGAGIDVNAQKANLEALWLDTTGNSRIFIFGTVLALDGNFYLKGVDRVPLLSGTTRAESWNRGVTSFASYTNACRVDGGWVVAESERGHACASDHFNGNPSGSVGGFMLIHRCYITDAGDSTAFQYTVTSDSNRNAISAHGGCDHISIGNVAEYSYGPNFADTSTASKPAASWLIGCVSRYSRASLESGNGGIGFIMQGLASAVDTGNRKSWLDGCVASDNSKVDAMQSTNGTMKQTYCQFGTTTGTITAYVPGTP